VEEREPAAGVFVDEREGGAGHGGVGAEAGGEAFDEVRLASAEVAAEGKDVAGAELRGKGAAVGDGPFRAGQNGRSHWRRADG
jgi:hypothetical protein